MTVAAHRALRCAGVVIVAHGASHAHHEDASEPTTAPAGWVLRTPATVAGPERLEMGLDDQNLRDQP